MRPKMSGLYRIKSLSFDFNRFFGNSQESSKVEIKIGSSSTSDSEDNWTIEFAKGPALGGLFVLTKRGPRQDLQRHSWPVRQQEHGLPDL